MRLPRNECAQKQIAALRLTVAVHKPFVLGLIYTLRYYLTATYVAYILYHNRTQN